MRTRRRRKFTWFPQLGFTGADPSDNTTVLPITPAVTPANGALSDVTVFPIVPDAPKDTAAAGTDNLDDFIANEYLLKRIVGRFWCTTGQPIDITSLNAVLDVVVGLGFFVARADGASTGFATPIGADTTTERKENYGPLALQNTREPWIWRRCWTLSFRRENTTTRVTQEGSYPHTNLNGSVAEGTHIDAKTARRVGNDDRLWAAVQTVATLVIGGPTDLQMPDMTMDVRVLGALRKARGRSAF